MSEAREVVQEATDTELPGMKMAKKLVKHDSSQFLVFTTNAGVGVAVRYEDGTIWLTQALKAELFDVDVSTVNYHLQQIFGSQELTEETTIGIFPIVRQEGSRQVTRQISTTTWKPSFPLATASTLFAPRNSGSGRLASCVTSSTKH